MTTKLLTGLIVAAVLAGSAAAALRATDAPVSAAQRSRTEPAPGGPLVFLIAPNDRFVVSPSGLKQRPPRIVLLTPRLSSAAN